MGTQKIAGNPVYHARAKHTDIPNHFIREVLEEGMNAISINHVSTEDKIDGILTKGLPDPNVVFA